MSGHDNQDPDGKDARDSQGESDGDKTTRPPGKQGDRKPEQRPARWPWLVATGLILGFVGVVLYIIFVPTPDVWTDDAYVTVHYATIAPRVAGQVATVEVDDNQTVRAGQVLFTLDPRDFETAVEEAQAALDRDRAQVTNASANVARQPPLIEEQQARVAEARARLALAQTNQRRYANLASTGAGTQQEHQDADTTLRTARATLDSAVAAQTATQRQMDVLKAQLSATAAVVKSDEARLEQARLNLSYTRVVAPLDGMVGQRSVQVGNYIAPGAVAMAIVPLSQIYIEANYREEALRHVLPGQPVQIHIDAYNIDLRGVVGSLPPASGASFSPIPPNNATGNFTKIVQRLPVKILVAPNQPETKLLRVGFSVETTIHTGLANVVQEQQSRPVRVTSR